MADSFIVGFNQWIARSKKTGHTAECHVESQSALKAEFLSGIPGIVEPVREDVVITLAVTCCYMLISNGSNVLHY